MKRIFGKKIEKVKLSICFMLMILAIAGCQKTGKNVLGDQTADNKQEESATTQDTAQSEGGTAEAESVSETTSDVKQTTEATQESTEAGNEYGIIYDGDISEIGAIESYVENWFDEENKDEVLLEIDLKWLKVNDSFAGADAINSYLSELQDENIQTAYWLGDNADGWRCGYSSTVSEITYFDGKYLSFYQIDYIYEGGAHGTPLKNGYTFDLETGEQLILWDMVEIDEEKLLEIVPKYYDELIDSEPERFWPDAKDVVRQNMNLRIDCCMTKEGICFWFYPYTLASYVEGFIDVVVPYEEFEMKIELEK